MKYIVTISINDKKNGVLTFDTLDSTKEGIQVNIQNLTKNNFFSTPLPYEKTIETDSYIEYSVTFLNVKSKISYDIKEIENV